MRLYLLIVLAFVILWAIMLCLALSPKISKAQNVGVLVCTVPSGGQNRYIDPSFGPDSVMVQCSGGPPVGVDSLKLYRYETGNFRFFRAYYVRGMEGQQFTSDSLPSGQYYMNAKNGAGESCGGNVVTLQAGVPTGVAETPVRLPGLGRLYDVRGRLVHGRPAAGIYFTKEKKRVVVSSRGEVISR